MEGKRFWEVDWNECDLEHWGHEEFLTKTAAKKFFKERVRKWKKAKPMIRLNKMV